MEQFCLKIPIRFLSARTPLTWSDVEFGLEKQLVDPTVAIDLAAMRLLKNEDSEQLLELASAEASAPIASLVKELATAEVAVDENELLSKWAFLVLAWIYETMDHDGDTLLLVEKVYADFGYPEELASIVRYMPMDGPDLGSREQNEQRLYENWQEYLEAGKSRFAG